MKITNIKINNWRNFRNVEFSIPEEAKLICLIGANGLGKTNILNLIGAVSHNVGISQGYSNDRPHPLEEEHDIEITFVINKPLDDVVKGQQLKNILSTLPSFEWNGLLVVRSIKNKDDKQAKTEILAQGKHSGTDEQKAFIGGQIKSSLRALESLNYVIIDADRSFPPNAINDNQILDAERKDFTQLALKRQESFQKSSEQYNNFQRFIIGKERQYNNEYAAMVREARRGQKSEPEFEDIFLDYNSMLKKILPHISYHGTDNGGKKINFSNENHIVEFHNLSGGEKEICFIVGQIFRYGLQNGMLLLDEPELHLNPDLTRKWIAFLKETVNEGQLWISTHAIEATEVASPDYTYLLSKNDETGYVESISPLSEKKTISELFSTVGMPAYSISNKKFILIEGPGNGSQKELFYRLTNYDDFRFVEADGCKQVLTRKEALDFFSLSENIPLNVYGVIDRDFKVDSEIESLSSIEKLFVLGVHEIENFFLNPDTLNSITNSQYTREEIIETIQTISKSFAGLWLIQNAATNFSTSPISKEMKKFVGEEKWDNILNNEEEFINKVIEKSSSIFEDKSNLKTRLEESLARFKELIISDDIWKFCMGKETLNTIPKHLGFINSRVIQDCSYDKWNENENNRPEELKSLMSFLSL